MSSRQALAWRARGLEGAQSLLAFSIIIHKERLMECWPQKEALIIVILNGREPPCSLSKATSSSNIPKF